MLWCNAHNRSETFKKYEKSISYEIVSAYNTLTLNNKVGSVEVVAVSQSYDNKYLRAAAISAGLNVSSIIN